MDDQFDVIIAGGGPAGSTTAAYLAKSGHSVALLEKAEFPREHVGESLLPFCYSIFEDLGVLDRLTSLFVRKPGVRFIDVDGRSHTTWCFGHVIKGPGALSFHVRRAEFDHELLKNSERLGAVVHQRTRVTGVELEAPDGGVLVTATGADGETRTLRARFFVDASGRDTFLATRMRTKRPHRELDRAALSTHWLEAQLNGGIDEGLLQIVYLGGEKKGWIWVIPVAHERVSIGLVLNHAYIREQKAKLTAAGVEDWREALYRQELESSTFVRGVIKGAKIAQPLAFNGNYSYYSERKFGDNFAIVGDAGAFIDPILASGVYLSIKSAQLVAKALHVYLTEDEDAGRQALRGAYDAINGAYSLVDRAIELFYNPVSINFAQVGGAAGLLHEEHKDALAAGHFLLAGDFFENHKKYLEFIELLQEPRTFRRYKKMVIKDERGDSATCGYTHDAIFGAIMKEMAS